MNLIAFEFIHFELIRCDKPCGRLPNIQNAQVTFFSSSNYSSKQNKKIGTRGMEQEYVAANIQKILKNPYNANHLRNG